MSSVYSAVCLSEPQNKWCQISLLGFPFQAMKLIVIVVEIRIFPDQKDIPITQVKTIKWEVHHYYLDQKFVKPTLRLRSGSFNKTPFSEQITYNQRLWVPRSDKGVL